MVTPRSYQTWAFLVFLDLLLGVRIPFVRLDILLGNMWFGSQMGRAVSSNDRHMFGDRRRHLVAGARERRAGPVTSTTRSATTLATTAINT
jgi:hypothetical protein